MWCSPYAPRLCVAAWLVLSVSLAWAQADPSAPTDPTPEPALGEASVYADLDADGTDERVALRRLSTNGQGPPRDYELVVERDGQVIPLRRIEQALGATTPDTRLPEELRRLQILPAEPCSVVDADLDGRDEVVLHIGRPRSRDRVETLIVEWDPTSSEVVISYDAIGDGVLLTDSSLQGDLVLAPYAFPESSVPIVFGPCTPASPDGVFTEAQAPLPRPVAAACLPLYERALSQPGAALAPTLVRAYSECLAALGRQLGAINALSGLRTELEDAERRLRMAKVSMLIAMGNLWATGETADLEQAAACYIEAHGLLADPTEAYLLEPVRAVPASAEAFAACGIAQAKASVGETDAAVAWLERAEALSGAPLPELRRYIDGFAKAGAGAKTGE
jgi:hypothetical protein